MNVRAFFAIAAVVATASAGHAKNICVQSSGGVTMVFYKVKSLGTPGRFSPLHGVASPDCAMTGTAYVDSSRVVHADVRIGCMQETGTALYYGWTADATLAGSGQADLDGNGSIDGARTFTAVDCSTLSLPFSPAAPPDTSR